VKIKSLNNACSAKLSHNHKDARDDETRTESENNSNCLVCVWVLTSLLVAADNTDVLCSQCCRLRTTPQRNSNVIIPSLFVPSHQEAHTQQRRIPTPPCPKSHIPVSLAKKAFADAVSQKETQSLIPKVQTQTQAHAVQYKQSPTKVKVPNLFDNPTQGDKKPSPAAKETVPLVAVPMLVVSRMPCAPYPYPSVS